MDEWIGKKIGRYEVVELLGKGGAAMVYRAQDTALDRPVALKLILPQQQHTDRFLKRFQREAKSLAQLSHPAVVKILDYGEIEGKPYLVTEYVSGGTLASRMGKPWNVVDAAGSLAQVAHALAYAHHRHIIHRDVKPSNILLNESGQPMLGDFGIVKLTDSDESQSLTGTGVMVGTPAYMAPEQIQGRPVDARTDVYALAVVFFEMITGRKPYLGATSIEVTIKHLNDPIPRARQFVRDLPAEVEQALLKGMAKKPEDRYQDMTAFAAVLDRFAAGKKGRAPVGAGQSAQNGAAAGSSTSSNPDGTPHDHSLPGEGVTRDDQAAEMVAATERRAPKARRRRAITAAILAVVVVAIGIGAWIWCGRQIDQPNVPEAVAAVSAVAKTPTRTPTIKPTAALTATKAATATVLPSPTPAAAVTAAPTLDSNRIQPNNLNQVIEINRLERVSVISMDWARDNQWIAVAGSKFITLINPTTMKTDQVISLGNNIPKTMALAPDSQSAYVLMGNQIHIYNLKSRQETAYYAIPNGANSLAVSPDGKLLALGTLDNKTILVNSDDGVVKRVLRSNYGGWAVAFSPDGSKVAAGTTQGVLMWEVQTGRLIAVPGEQNTLFKTMTFSNDGTKLAAGSDGKIVVWDLIDKSSRTLTTNPEKGFASIGVNVLRYTPDDVLLVSASDDHLVRLWDLTKGAGNEVVLKLTSHGNVVNGVCISPDGRFIASGGANEGVVRLWGLP